MNHKHWNSNQFCSLVILFRGSRVRSRKLKNPRRGGHHVSWLPHNHIKPKLDKTSKVTFAPEWRLRSAWASTQSDQSLYCLPEECFSPWLMAIHKVHREDWSDRADAQAELSLRCEHRSCSDSFNTWAKAQQSFQNDKCKQQRLGLLATLCISKSRGPDKIFRDISSLR